MIHQLFIQISRTISCALLTVWATVCPGQTEGGLKEEQWAGEQT